MEESRTTAAQTLDVVHGLVNNMEVVMEGGRFSFVWANVMVLSAVRWQGIDRRDQTSFGYAIFAHSSILFYQL
jgi:hypothetical protein